MSNKENEKKILMKCVNYYNSAVAKQKKIFINDHWYRNKVIRNENWSIEEFCWVTKK